MNLKGEQIFPLHGLTGSLSGDTNGKSSIKDDEKWPLWGGEFNGQQRVTKGSRVLQCGGERPAMSRPAMAS